MGFKIQSKFHWNLRNPPLNTSILSIAPALASPTVVSLVNYIIHMSYAALTLAM